MCFLSNISLIGFRSNFSVLHGELLRLWSSFLELTNQSQAEINTVTCRAPERTEELGGAVKMWELLRKQQLFWDEEAKLTFSVVPCTPETCFYPPHRVSLPEYHHVWRSLGEGGDEAGETQQDHEGLQEVRTSAAAGPGKSKAGTAGTADTPTLSVVLQKQTQCQDWAEEAVTVALTFRCSARTRRWKSGRDKNKKQINGFSVQSF